MQSAAKKDKKLLQFVSLFFFRGNTHHLAFDLWLPVEENLLFILYEVKFQYWIFKKNKKSLSAHSVIKPVGLVRRGFTFNAALVNFRYD